jgi:hypothetical protein
MRGANPPGNPFKSAHFFYVDRGIGLKLLRNCLAGANGSFESGRGFELPNKERYISHE